MEAVARRELMTLEEWAALPDGVPGEWVDGRLEEEEMASFAHALCVSWLAMILGTWLEDRRFVFTSDSKYRVSEARGRKPDLSVCLPGRSLPSRRDSMSSKPPSIAAEVVTPTPRDQRRDRVEKLGGYAAFGVSWYWILDPELRTLEILELDALGRYAHVVGRSAGQIAPVPGCEGLVVDLDALWARLDALPSDDVSPGREG